MQLLVDLKILIFQISLCFLIEIKLDQITPKKNAGEEGDDQEKVSARKIFWSLWAPKTSLLHASFNLTQNSHKKLGEEMKRKIKIGKMDKLKEVSFNGQTLGNN